MNTPVKDFRTELEHLINKYSRENGSNTPDFILAQYLNDCLLAFDLATRMRDTWYGKREKDDADAK